MGETKCPGGLGGRHTGLHDQLVGGLNHLTPSIVSTMLAGPMHDLWIATVVALHELRGFQLIVVRRATLSGAGL